MTFKLETMTMVDANNAYSSSKGKSIFGLVVRSSSDGTLDRWSVDHDRGLYIYWLRRSGPRLPRVRYMLSIEGELVIFELDKAGALAVTAKLLHLPGALEGRETELQEIFKEGFTVGADEFIGFECKFGEVQMSFAPRVHPQ